MNIVYSDFDNINSISIIIKKNRKWYIQHSKNEEEILPIEISVFLLKYNQFIQISTSKIINLCTVTAFLDNKNVVVLDNTSFNISDSYLSFFKIAYKVFDLQKNKMLEFNKYVHPFKKIDFQNKYIKKLVDIDFRFVKYILREGFKTKFFFKDGTYWYSYNTLKDIKILLENDFSFVLIHRRCIVNIRYVNSCQIVKREKIGILQVESQNFTISRRLLSSFISKAIQTV